MEVCGQRQTKICCHLFLWKHNCCVVTFLNLDGVVVLLEKPCILHIYWKLSCVCILDNCAYLN